MIAKLIHKKNVILSEMKYLTSILSISAGLMFSGKKRCSRGVCMVMPSSKDVRYGSAVTMMFCFCSLEIIFVNSKFKVVDKVILRPWIMSYIPKAKAKYIIEAYPEKLENIKIGDKIKIELNK